jgi:ribosome maturation factor RimP
MPQISEGFFLPLSVRETVMALAEPLLAARGYELVDIEWTTENGHRVLRVFIDHPTTDKGHISVEDCETVSRELSVLLDSKDPVPEEYLLEVSSPGFDRLLRTPAHFARFVGARVKIELNAERAGQRRYTGTLLRVGADGIELEVDTGHVSLPFIEIGKARIAA